VKDQLETSFSEALKKVLQSKGYPKNPVFEHNLKENNLYGAGSKPAKIKLILSLLEEFLVSSQKIVIN
jgi:hypothetical protein